MCRLHRAEINAGQTWTVMEDVMHLLILTHAELPPPDCPVLPWGLAGVVEATPLWRWGGRGRGDRNGGVLGRIKSALGVAMGLRGGRAPGNAA